MMNRIGLQGGSIALVLAAVCLVVSSAEGQDDAEVEVVRMKIVAQNPSKDEDKVVYIKEDIPEEIVSESDILSVHSDLELIYDKESGTYFVVCKEKEIEINGEVQKARAVVLNKGEQRVYTVELRDVWKIRNEELSSYQKRLNEVMGVLEGTEYAEESGSLGQEALNRLAAIDNFQKDETVNRKEQIIQFRRNKQRMEQILGDIETLESYVDRTKDRPTKLPGDTEIPPEKSLLWLVIFIILTFLGILSAVFYFVWHKRAKTMDSSLGAHDTAFQDSRKEK